MKKIINIITIGLILYCLFGCKQNTDVEHNHEYSSEWSFDEVYHWHSAICEHGNEICDKAEHEFGDYTYNNDATEQKTGTKSRKCKICGYENKASKIPANGPYSASYKFTESVRILSDETEGTLGKSGKYVEFGDFPQTIASSSIKFNPRPEENGYYVGSDGCYYEKVIVSVYEMCEFSDGTSVIDDEIRYFKVEPIKWRVLTENYNTSGNALLLAENILISNVPYWQDRDIGVVYGTGDNHRNGAYANNYYHSEIRAYLNGISYDSHYEGNEDKWLEKGFLQKAFSKDAEEKIVKTLVKNDGDSTIDTEETYPLKKADGVDTGYPNYTCDDCEDKIFLLSFQEMTTVEYGFDLYNKNKASNTRIRKLTDYALANNSESREHETEAYYGWWMLRTPSYESNNCYRIVGHSGDIQGSQVRANHNGIVPALTILLQ